jgi:hypothetical protein
MSDTESKTFCNNYPTPSSPIVSKGLLTINKGDVYAELYKI